MHSGFEPAQISSVTFLVNGQPVDALGHLVHHSKAREVVGIPHLINQSLRKGGGWVAREQRARINTSRSASEFKMVSRRMPCRYSYVYSLLFGIL